MICVNRLILKCWVVRSHSILIDSRGEEALLQIGLLKMNRSMGSLKMITKDGTNT